jgi:hypothetical protein
MQTPMLTSPTSIDGCGNWHNGYLKVAGGAWAFAEQDAANRLLFIFYFGGVKKTNPSDIIADKRVLCKSRLS